MEVGRRNYNKDDIEAARQVLTEIAHLFDEFRDGIVLIGGWVPFFAIPQEKEAHEGTKDVDIAIDPRDLSESAYQTMGEKLVQSLYQQDTRKPFRYHRTVHVKDAPVSVILDILTGEDASQTQNGSLYEVQDIKASAMHGCDMAFLTPETISFTGQHPDGGIEEVTVRVAALPTFLAMKGLALHNRGGKDGQKDAYDIFYCIKNFPGGLDSLAEQFRPFVSHPLVREGLTRLAEKFASMEHIGPRFVSDQAADEDLRLLLKRDSYEQVNALLEQIGFPP